MTCFDVKPLIDQSRLPYAVFRYDSGDIIYHNPSFYNLYVAQHIACLDEFLSKLHFSSAERFEVDDLRSMLQKDSVVEKFGSMTLRENRRRDWVWTHFEVIHGSRGKPSHIAVLVYFYHDDLPPLDSGLASPVSQTQEFLSHDLNSVFMSLVLAIEELEIAEDQRDRFKSIVESAQARKDVLINRVLGRLEHPEFRIPEPTRSEISHPTNLKQLPKCSLLIVEDDLDLLRQLCSGLQRRGYRCLAARGSDEVMEFIRAGETPRIALIDLRLDGEDGRMVQEMISTKQPQVKTIFMTAYANWAALTSLESAHRVLRKPFTINYLESTIIETLLSDTQVRADNVGDGDSLQLEYTLVTDVSIRQLANALYAGDSQYCISLLSDYCTRASTLTDVYRSAVIPALRMITKHTGNHSLQLQIKRLRVLDLVARTFSVITTMQRDTTCDLGTVIVGGPATSQFAGVQQRILSEILRFNGYLVFDIGPTASPEVFIGACEQQSDLTAVCLGPWSHESHDCHRRLVSSIRSRFNSDLQILLGGCHISGLRSEIPPKFELGYQLFIEGVVDSWANDYVFLSEALSNQSRKVETGIS